jgi:hypothetical protein
LLAKPDFHTGPKWTRTLGDEVAELGQMVGFDPYPEQRLVLDDVFALDPSDLNRSAAFEVAAIACRQQMKTGLLKLCALGWLFITDQPLVIWSAHEFGTSREAFRDILALVEASDYLSRRVQTVTTAAGNEQIELTSGARLKFKARTSGGGRGLTGSKVILDEAFALMPEHMGALLPTLIAVPDPQVLYGSSAGMAKSEILRSLRNRGRVGGGRLAYTEWTSTRRDCAIPTCQHVPGTEGCALDDVDLWRQACIVTARKDPDMGPIRALRDAMPPDEFMRECLGWWDADGTAAAFGVGRWEACATVERPEGLTPGALAVAVSFDLSHAAIGAAAVDADGTLWLRPLEHGTGIDWLAESARRLQDLYDVDVVVDGRGPAASLLPNLERASVRVKVATTADALDAYDRTYRAVREGTARHPSNSKLDTAVASAVPRPVGDRFTWGRKMSGSDISLLESVTLAAGAAMAPPPAPSEPWGVFR